MKDRRTTILDLPLELRQQVYRYCLRHNTEIRTATLYFHPGSHEIVRNCILLVHRKISEDALEMLYGENLFEVELHNKGADNIMNFSEANRKRIRHLRLVGQPKGESYKPGFEMDSALWTPILQDLKILCLVMQQPRTARTCDNDPTMEKWIEWLTPILAYLKQQLWNETRVKADGREKTGSLIKEYFPDKIEIVQDIAADFYFNRGTFQSAEDTDDFDAKLSLAAHPAWRAKHEHKFPKAKA